MCEKRRRLRAQVTERLTAAAHEICALFERTIAEYEEELSRSKEENQRKQRLLDSALCASGVHPQSADDEASGTTGPESSEMLQIKQEVDELSIKPETPPPQASVCTMSQDEDQTDDDEEWERAVQLSTPPHGTGQRRHSETHRETERPAPKPTVEGTRGKPFSCSVCEKTFTQKATLRIHMSTHFDSQKHVVTERLKEHVGEKPFHCGLCGKTFKHLDRYKSHRAHRHTGVKPFSCSECGARFCQRRNAVGHMSVHTGLFPFKCPECDAQFVQKKALMSHSKKSHKSLET
ncbi:hypothetical protein NQD34_002942 [Periophthalmus magnuspinnatus]|nr:hypothetical protein NQD34_002942 [Periophthalmus magnuspinnatus]